MTALNSEGKPDGHWFLSDAELAEIRAALNARRVAGAYEPGKWCVSPFNRDPKIVGEYPKSVKLRDITLRTIEQTPVVSVDPEQRVKLATALVEAGVPSLQIALRAWSDPEESNREAKRLHELAPDVELTVTGVLSRNDIDNLAGSGMDTIRFFMPALAAITPTYYPEVVAMAWRGEDWRAKFKIKTLKDQIRAACELVDHGKQRGFKMGAGINLVAYADDEHLEQYCTAVGNAGADYIDLQDGSGGLGPEAVDHVVRSVRRYAPKSTVAVHLHNTFGLGTANSVAAVKAGAGVVEVSVNSLCSASGQADLAEVAASLEIVYGVNTGIKLDKLTALRELVEDFTGVKMAQNKAVTGTRAWAYIAETVALELLVDPLIHYCVEPEVFGNRKLQFIGKIGGSGPALYLKLKEIGLDVERAEVAGVLKAVRREIGLRRRELSDEEFREILHEVRRKTASTG